MNQDSAIARTFYIIAAAALFSVALKLARWAVEGWLAWYFN